MEGEFCSLLSHAAWVMNSVHEGLYCTHQNLALSSTACDLELREVLRTLPFARQISRSLTGSIRSVCLTYLLLTEGLPTNTGSQRVIKTKQSNRYLFILDRAKASLKLLHLPLCLPGWTARGLAAGRHLGGPEPHPPPLKWVHTCELSLSTFIHSFIRGADASITQLMTFSAFILLGRTALPLYFRKKPTPFPIRSKVHSTFL